MRVLVAGCGYVGAELAGQLAASGHRVWGLRRRPAGLPPGVEPLAADLTRPATLADLPADLEVVVYAAAADAADEGAYRATYVDGPRHLLAALAGQGQRPRRLLFTSSTGVYGQDDGSWVDEDSPAEPATATGRVLLEGERLLREGPFPATVVRLAGLYGPGRLLLVDQLRSGAAEVTAGRAEYLNLVHRDDAAGLLAHLAGVADPAPLYLGVDWEPAERSALLGWLAERLGVAPPRVVADRRGGRHGGNKRCSNRRLLDSGHVFRFPTWRDGYADLLGPT